MNDTYAAWQARHPQAALELQAMIADAPWPGEVKQFGKSEAWAQQQNRFQAARQGAGAWRNNVGATPAKTRHSCPKCTFRFEEKQQPVRYGLANDSHGLNEEIKSSDLILAIPRIITPVMVGTKIAQFGSVECKPPGWVFNPNDAHEGAQLKWLTHVANLGGFAQFNTGDLRL